MPIVKKYKKLETDNNIYKAARTLARRQIRNMAPVQLDTSGQPPSQQQQAPVSFAKPAGGPDVGDFVSKLLVNLSDINGLLKSLKLVGNANGEDVIPRRGRGRPRKVALPHGMHGGSSRRKKMVGGAKNTETITELKKDKVDQKRKQTHYANMYKQLKVREKDRVLRLKHEEDPTHRKAIQDEKGELDASMKAAKEQIDKYKERLDNLQTNINYLVREDLIDELQEVLRQRGSPGHAHHILNEINELAAKIGIDERLAIGRYGHLVPEGVKDEPEEEDEEAPEEKEEHFMPEPMDNRALAIQTLRAQIQEILDAHEHVHMDKIDPILHRLNQLEPGYEIYDGRLVRQHEDEEPEGKEAPPRPHQHEEEEDETIPSPLPTTQDDSSSDEEVSQPGEPDGGDSSSDEEEVPGDFNYARVSKATILVILNQLKSQIKQGEMLLKKINSSRIVASSVDMDSMTDELTEMVESKRVILLHINQIMEKGREVGDYLKTILSFMLSGYIRNLTTYLKINAQLSGEQMSGISPAPDALDQEEGAGIHPQFRQQEDDMVSGIQRRPVILSSAVRRINKFDKKYLL